MGRKKAGEKVNVQAARPFCFYCDRTFEDENILLQHQRAKHFRCLECDIDAIRGKCESVQGLLVHTLKVHSKSLAKVPNAKPGRDNPELNVYGMDGIPSEVLKERGIERHELVGKAAPPPNASTGFSEGTEEGWQKAPPMPMVPMPPMGNSMPMPMPMLMPPVPGGMPGMPPMQGVGGAPSLEGFQQFLAAQKAPPNMDAGAPAPSHRVAEQPFGGGFPPQAPLPVQPLPIQPQLAAQGDGQVAALAMPGNGSAPPQLVPQKRRLEEEVGGEDVSVEEMRAQLGRYRLLR